MFPLHVVFLYWHYPHVWGPEGPGLKLYSVIRQEDWKLIYFHENQKFELYNTKTDISENNNLSTKYPNIVKNLALQLGSYLKQANTKMPIVSKTGKTVMYPDEILTN